MPVAAVKRHGLEPQLGRPQAKAIELLWALPDSDLLPEEDTKQNPIKLASSEDDDAGTVALLRAKGGWSNLRVESVDMSALTTNQGFISANSVQAIITGHTTPHRIDPSSWQGADMPVVFRRIDGTLVLMDGNHRAVADMLQGRSKLKARILEERPTVQEALDARSTIDSKSLASDQAVRTAALDVFEALPYKLQHQVEDFLHGVVANQAQTLEKHADLLWDLYTPVRDLVRRHGDTVTLHRGEPVDKPAIARRFLSWSPSRKMATLFAPKRGYEVVSADVDVDDVVAVLTSPHNKGYIEYLVRDRKSYHESGQQLPLMGRVDFDMPYDGFTIELAQTMLARLERELAKVGGRVLQSHVNEEQETAMAYVLVPPTVTVDENDSTFLGEFEAQNLEPYTRLEERAKGRTVKMRLSELRAIVQEALEDKSIRAELEELARARKPFLHGRWQRGRHMPGTTADMYTATDESGRTFTLVVSSDVVYKNVGRLRDPKGTKHVWSATVGFDPNDSPFNGVRFADGKVIGEDFAKNREAETKFRQKVFKVFGLDPFSYAGPLE